jgi:carbamoylphosphate synthase small subunit
LNQAILALEDGTVFEGKSFGAPKDRLGAVVFRRTDRDNALR